MVDKTLNIFFYKDGEYTRAYSSVAPTVFENAIDKFTEKDVEFWKSKAETRFNNYTPGSASTNGTAIESNGAASQPTSDAELPF